MGDGEGNVRGEGGRVPGLESGHGGSLWASRVFTNEGSKKEKKGLEGQADPLLGKAQFFPSLAGVGARNGGSICPEKRCQLQVPTPCSDSTLRSPTAVGLEESRHPVRMGTPGGGRHHPGGKQKVGAMGSTHLRAHTRPEPSSGGIS